LVVDQVDHRAAGRQHQGAAHRAQVARGQAALVVEVRQRQDVELAERLAGGGDHLVAPAVAAHDLHRPGVEQRPEALGRDPVGAVAAGDGTGDRVQRADGLLLFARASSPSPRWAGRSARSATTSSTCR
jgi:hypothetical protein